jgi:Tfp pilus assembly protein PilV
MVLFTVAAMGILALQANMMRHNLNGQVRAQASFYAEQLIGLAMADPANVRCYTVGNPGACASATAGAMVADWEDSVLRNLPGAGTFAPSATFNAATSRFQLTLRWKREQEATLNNLVVETAVRP